MKKIYSILISIVAGVFFVGCDASSLAPIQNVPQIQHDTITLPGQTITNPDGSVTVIPPKSVDHVQTNMVAQVNPAWSTSIDTVKSINTLANPTPFAPLITLGLGALSGVLGLIVNVKNKQITTQQAVTNTIVKGVELANTPAVKQTIQDLALVHGTADALHTIVKAATNGAKSL